MNAAAPSERTGPEPRTRPSRFWIAVLVFLVYETLLILLLNGDLAGEITSDLLYLAIVIIGAGAGYLLLGAVTGAWQSAFALAVPVVVAYVIGGSAETDSVVTDGIPLYIAWMLFTIFFLLPAWLVGILVSRILRDPEAAP
jgi:hypothetical protein